jgi:arsenate reductase-like glutaredoxin family protein
MKLTINDFKGYNNDCSTIKKIKVWIEEKGGEFTATELIDTFRGEHYDFEREVIKYLKSNLIKTYINDVLKIDVEMVLVELEQKSWDLECKYKRFEGVDNIEELLSYKQKLESEYQSKYRELAKEIEKYKGFENFDDLLQQNQNLKNGWNYKQGTVIQVLNYFFKQSFQSQSYLTTNSLMYNTLNSLCSVAFFNEDDFSEIIKNFNFSYWGGNHIERFYATAIVSDNNSAWKSIEKLLNRTPFILKNKRMYEGITFNVIQDDKRVKYRCTGWNDAGKIKFVTENTDNQKRMSFDNKEFKAYFKTIKIEF